jgi:hypothetical protein
MGNQHSDVPLNICCDAETETQRTNFKKSQNELNFSFAQNSHSEKCIKNDIFVE